MHPDSPPGAPASQGPKRKPRIGRTRRIVNILAILVALPFIYIFAFEGLRFFRIPSSSMEPLIEPEDFILTLHADRYERGDIIVFRDPDAPDEYLVKRIVGVEDDRIAVRGGALFLNGSYASEPYSFEPLNYEMDPYEVRPAEVFVLGDNRNISVDSHNWGQDSTIRGDRGILRGIPVDRIVGRVRMIYLPFHRRRIVHSYPLANLDGT